ncbi:hypothetical protein BD310DRAFT_940235 [Dichomitus squalens]|uniref:BTB domain-containing protein n=1 Tax=Dichomitus squalens TaxID=114155 RepID=A0A4Q9PEB0_9APHY|nr:hypothetical protein BD310DRAFT_940235 [Dichomitus squalens]
MTNSEGKYRAQSYSFDTSSASTSTIQDRGEHALWFADGNVVVVAQDTCFRVHQGVLAFNSPIFRDILEDIDYAQVRSDKLGITIDRDETGADGTVIRLSDSAHDFEHLLRIFYQGFDYLKTTRPDDFADLAAAARLAHKYDTSRVLNEATTRLQQLFPPSFEVWDANARIRASKRFRPDDAIEAVNLCRALGRRDGGDDMFPAAVYLCSQLELGHLLRGHRRADGTLEKLDVGELELCLVLKETSVKSAADMAVKLYAGRVSANCSGGFWINACMRILAGARQGPAMSQRFTKALRGDPLGEWLRDEIDAAAKAGLCSSCTRMLRYRERDLRKAFWEKLPGLVGVKVEA